MQHEEHYNKGGTRVPGTHWRRYLRNPRKSSGPRECEWKFLMVPLPKVTSYWHHGMVAGGAEGEWRDSVWCIVIIVEMYCPFFQRIKYHNYPQCDARWNNVFYTKWGLHIMTCLSSVFCNIKNYKVSHGQVAQLVGALSHTPKWCWFNPWSGHTHMLCVGLIPGRCVYKRKRINVSFSHQCFSLFLSLSLPLYLKSIKTYPWVRIFFKKQEELQGYWCQWCYLMYLLAQS